MTLNICLSLVQTRSETYRPLDEVPCVLCGSVLAGVVDDHALYDVGHLIFQLQMRRQYVKNHLDIIK